MENVRAAVRFTCVLLVALAAPRDAEACSCMPSGPPCQGFFEVQAVFIGTVRSMTLGPRAPTVTENLRVEFEDAVALRGVDGPAQTVMTSVPDGASCGYPFKEGGRYVVYAYRAKPGEPLRTNVCLRTRPVADAADDLLFFTSLSTEAPGSRVFGSITHSEFNLASRDIRQYGPVPDIRLRLKNEDRTYQATSDARGRYEFAAIPPGRYDLAIELPLEFSSGDREKRVVDITDSRGCAEVNFVMRFNGRVTGSIRGPGGSPAAAVRVQMMPIEHVDAKGVPQTIDAMTDSAGRFAFTAVTPGRYVLGVDLFRIPDVLPDPAVAFPVTYHPGTADPRRATVIELRGGELHALEPMTLPPARRPYQLTGIVTSEDGTPAAGVLVDLLDASRTWLEAAPPVETDGAGAFSFRVHEGLSYIVSASYRGRDARGQRRIPATVGPIVVTKEPAPLRIVVSRP
jgi:hypothetical protein